MAADIDYVRINKNPMQRKQWEISFIPCAYIVGGNCTFPFYWMVVTSIKGYGAYNSEKYQVYCNVAYVGELQKCIHISASFKISGKYFVVYRCDNCIDVGCGDTCGLCLCKDEIQG